MKLLLITGLIIIMGAGLTGCYQDVIYPDAAVDPEGPPQAVSFSAELEPMFNSKCSSCHYTGGQHKPYLEIGASYNSLVNGGYVNTSVPKESELYIAINGPMEEYIPSATDRQKVYDWIRNGAPNN